MGARTRSALPLLAFLGALLVAFVTVRFFSSGPVRAVATTAPAGAPHLVSEAAPPRTSQGRAAAPAPRDEASATRAIDERDAGKDAGDGRGCRLHGRLLDHHGDPLEERLFVEVRDRDGGRRAANVSTDGSRYEVERLAPGPYWVAVRASGWNEVEEEVLVPPDADAVERDLVLSREPLLHVKAHGDDGRPLVLAVHERTELALRAAATAQPIGGPELDPALEIGAFRRLPSSQGAELGGIELPRTRDVHVSLLLGDAVLASLPAPAGTEEVAFRVAADELDRRLTTLRLRLVDARSGLPVESGTITIDEHAVADDSCVRFLTERDRGVLETRVPVGATSLRIVADGYEERILTVSLAPGPVDDLGDVPLEPASPIAVRGRVVGPPGVELPLERTGLWIGREGEEGASLRRGKIRPDGSFELSLREGSHRIRAILSTPEGRHSAEGRADVRRLEMEEGPVDGPLLELVREGRLLLRPTRACPTPARLVIRDAGGSEVLRRTLAGRSPRAVHLPPGVYRIHLEEEDGPWTQTLEVALHDGDAELSVGP